MADDVAAGGRGGANKAFAVEHVADQLAIAASTHGVARAGYVHGGGRFVEPIDDRGLVRHGDKSAVKIGETADLGKASRKFSLLTPRGTTAALIPRRANQGLYMLGALKLAVG